MAYAKESLHVQYRNYRQDLRSFPPESSIYKRIQEDMKDFLKKVATEYGQKAVDEITGMNKEPKQEKVKKITKRDCDHTTRSCAYPNCLNVCKLKKKCAQCRFSIRHKWCSKHRKEKFKEDRAKLK